MIFFSFFTILPIITYYLALWEMWTSQSRVHRGVPVSTEVRRSPSPCLTIYWEMEEKPIF